MNLAKGYRGGERQTLILVRECVSHYGASNVIVVARKGQPLADRCRNISGLRVIEVTHQLDGHFRLNGPILLHAHEARAVHFCWFNHVCFGNPYIITRRVQDALKNKWLTRKTYSAAMHVVSISSWIQCHLMASGFSSDVIPSAVQCETPNESGSRAPSDTFGLLHLGALVDQHKGQSVAIESLAYLPSHVNLTCVGDGPDAEHLKVLSTRLGLSDRVHFFPWDDDYLRHEAGKFDGFVFPSNHEGLGSVLLDVMCARIPVVASNVGGIPDLIQHEVTGLLAAPGKPKDFAAQILRLIEDEALREKIVEQARDRVSSFSPEVMFKQYDEIYQRVIAHAN